ncbi:SufS family cysteine desulfurase [Mariniblastus sp.]|nr:SufS family cysteine desulfurase [Mariniblastus sp.]MDA7885170.1 SufS family cysteine desulfurase [bacterium]MDA7887395.1 SufS family cysteine desulfurase [bacterium]MDA7887615.1 SufS family cysteine desulfurase [bacterium]MDA7903850.1 SufS family cysteine desulfurase [Mariniblastus sp.]
MQVKQKKAFDPIEIRGDFPILNQTIHRERPLIYFDNGASTQHPKQVLEAMDDCYVRTYANVHRGIHWLSEQSSALYEQARTSVRRFINASHSNEVIFTSGTTESINLIARSWGDANLKSGDEILLTMLEHHSNIVPWQQLAERTGALVKFIQLTDAGELDLEHMRSLLSARTKIASFASVSNVLGSRASVVEMTAMAKSVGALVVVDAAQSVPHDKTDVQAWGADFIAFSGHKMLGPSGVGVLWGRQSILESMQPFMGGGSMIDQVTTDGFTWGELPARFEAGTPPIVEAIGLGAAIDYLENVDVAQIEDHEQVLVRRAYELIMEVDGAKILGPAADCRSGLVSFVIEGVASQDISILLDQQGIAIRAGHHCAMPLHKHLEIKASCRASFYLYNTLDEVEKMGAALKKVVQRLR